MVKISYILLSFASETQIEDLSSQKKRAKCKVQEWNRLSLVNFRIPPNHSIHFWSSFLCEEFFGLHFSTSWRFFSFSLSFASLIRQSQILHAGSVSQDRTLQIHTTTKQQRDTENQWDMRRNKTGGTQKRVREGRIERVLKNRVPGCHRRQ